MMESTQQFLAWRRAHCVYNAGDQVKDIAGNVYTVAKDQETEDFVSLFCDLTDEYTASHPDNIGPL